VNDRRENMFGLIRRKPANWVSSSNFLLTRDLCLGATLPNNGGGGTMMEHLITQLQSHVHKVLDGGGPEAVNRNNSRNKLLPRQRIHFLLDPGSSFLELSQVLNSSSYLNIYSFITH
jgi:3-methylcrotonyl-CoA carboxylase beta subunit